MQHKKQKYVRPLIITDKKQHQVVWLSVNDFEETYENIKMWSTKES